MTYKNLDNMDRLRLRPGPARLAANAAMVKAIQDGTIKRDRQARWDREHLRTVGCKLRTDEADRFKAATARLKVSQYQVIRFMVLRWMEYAEALEGGVTNARPDSYKPGP